MKLLTANGYLAHQSGKWWEGSFEDGGFTHGMTHGDPKRRGRHGDEGLTIGRAGMKPITDFLDHANAEKKPFLLWYAPFLPHTPHNPPPRLLEKYTQPGRAADVAKYYAMCEWFDETCGELLGHLESRGLGENTLVIYICDNGWAATSENAADPNQKLWKEFSLRSKSSPYENGIRTPIMLSWPGRLEPADSPNLAHAIDLFPTIAAATGIEAPKNLPGINLLDETAREGRDTVFGVCNATHNITVGAPDDTLLYLWCVSGEPGSCCSDPNSRSKLFIPVGRLCYGDSRPHTSPSENHSSRSTNRRGGHMSRCAAARPGNASSLEPLSVCAEAF